MATAVANYVLLGKGNQLLVKLLNFVPTAPLMERERGGGGGVINLKLQFYCL